VTAADLRRDKPYLYSTILLVASNMKPARQLAMGKEIFHTITTSLLLRGVRNLDLLQSLLVYSAWFVALCALNIICWKLTEFSHRSYDQFSVNPQLTNLVQLTMGLLFDLGLRNTERTSCLENAMIHASITGKSTNKEVASSEEKRALLGCFFLSSV